jgi:uncharacterized protein (DUF433 family)
MIERPVCFLVVSDPEILGGDPVFRGTRVPVRSLAVTRVIASLND